MFAGTALFVRLLIYAGLSLFIISGPYLYMVVCVLYAYNLTLTPPIDPSIHPPMGGDVGGGVSTNHKSSNRIELSRLGQDFLNF